MLFKIQMAAVSAAIFFLFSPSFSFFLQINSNYIYISTINANKSTHSPQNLKFTALRRNQYPPPQVPIVITPPTPKSNAIKIGNPTSQCALLGLKLVQLSTLAGRIFFCHGRQSSDGVHMELIRSWYAPKLRLLCVYNPSLLHPNFFPRHKKKSYQPVCSIGLEIGPISYFKEKVVYLHHWGCAYQDICVLGVASTTGGVPS